MYINLSPKEILKINLYLILFLLFANIMGIISKYYFGHDSVYGLVPLFNFNAEKNIPTFYSSFALLFASILLSLIAFKRKNIKLPYISWFVLALIFLFLSFDEISSIHERLTIPVRETFGTSGFLYYAWIIPYGFALVAFIIAYLKFLFELPKRIMILFLISGAIFVSGAIGFEMLGGRQDALYGENNVLYSVISTCEELLEMLGIAMFIYTLLKYIVNEFGLLRINIDKKHIE